jgi:pimeloyl-ACP methyl ester carboxylesterase
MMVTVQGADIFVREQGAGEPVLMLHGVPDDGSMWDGVIRELGSGYRFIAPDLPGLGKSTAPKNFDLSLNNMARFVNELLDKLNVHEKVHLFVHDFGGHYGLAWAAKYPERVRSLTISNTSFFTSFRWHQAAQMWRAPILGHLMLLSMPKGMTIKTMREASPGLSDEYLNRAFDEGFGVPAHRRMIRRLYRERNPQKDFVGWEDDLRAVAARVPSLVVWGDLDPFAASHHAESFGAQTVKHIANAGHWVPVEAPAEVAAAFKANLEAARA